MLPNKNDNRWKMLVKGEINYDFKAVPAALIISRIKRQTAKDSSDSIVSKYIDEVYTFFEKYESILTADINAIFK